ncbi:MAG: RNA polymerase sigma factor [Bacteroidota bacterium]
MNREPDGLDIATLYERYASRILNVAYRFTGDKMMAEDMMQDAFIIASEKQHQYDGRAQPYTWLYRIAVNHIINTLKREKRYRWMNMLERPVQDLFQREHQKQGGQDPGIEERADHQLERKEMEQRIWKAITRLKESYRVPLVLQRYEGWGNQEIADELGLSVSAVESRIHRAKKQLAMDLKEWAER